MLAVDTHKLKGIVAVSLNTKAAGLVDQGAPSARRARGSLNNLCPDFSFFLSALCRDLGRSFSWMRFLGELALSVSVEVEQIAEVFPEIPDRVDCDVTGKMDSVRRGGNLQDELAAAIELAQERFAIE